MHYDLSPAELRDYRSSQTEPADFDDFWSRTLDESRAFDTEVIVTPIDSPLATINAYDVTFPGYGGAPIRGWLRLPRGASEPLPTVVEYVGYGGGRGLVEDWLFWASCGFAHFHMDTRGQGSTWSAGDTPDPGASGPHYPGMMTVGIEDPNDYYYRRVITDAVRALDATDQLPFVDPGALIALGTSQGGGIALAVAGLSSRIAALVSYVPFLCDFPRAITVTDSDPYKEISRYLAIHRAKEARALETLSYFDGVNFAKRASAPAEFTTSQMDDICPPSTVFGAFNEYAGEKSMTLWNHNGHEGGARDDDVRVARLLQSRFLPAPSSI